MSDSNASSDLSVDLPPLSADDFSGFFGEVYGYRPYAWQTDLMGQADAEGWPDYLSMPTGSGKTTVIDIAVFLLAVQADRRPSRRTAATRMFFVVDRRVVVAEADRRARGLAAKLRVARGSGGVLTSVAERLRHLASSDGRPGNSVTPLEAHTLRGGFYRPHAWATSLVQPTVVTSTVDQVGSRLLFRGYGVSPQSRPLQAALVGHDSLIILDEAHTSVSFARTVQTVASYQQRSSRAADMEDGPRGVRCLQMTATPPPSADPKECFRFDPDRDLTDETNRLATGYQTSKPTRLCVAEKVKATSDRKFAKILAERVTDTLDDAAPTAVAVVVNRVGTARTIAGILGESSKIDADVELMIGSMRPVDRDGLAMRLSRRLSDRENGYMDRSLVVVTTQCLEVGADLDFDFMISEAASLDSLRQRFGRLNRAGRDVHAGGEIWIREFQHLGEAKLERLKDEDADPIYGPALSRTFDWLRSVATSDDQPVVDMGVAAMDRAVAELLDETNPDGENNALLKLLPPRGHDVHLQPTHVDLLCQTDVHRTPAAAATVDGESRRRETISVHPDPDVRYFLHGRQTRRAEVAVCWRADLCVTRRGVAAGDTSGKEPPIELHSPLVSTVADVKDETADGIDAGLEPKVDARVRSAMVALVGDMPPTSAECMNVGWRSIKGFLIGAKDSSDADQPMMETDDPRNEDDQIPPNRQPVVWRGRDRSFVARSMDEIRPGDVLVLPVAAGGWSQLGYVPPINIDGRPFAIDPAVRRADLTKDGHQSFLSAVDVADRAALAATWRFRTRLVGWCGDPDPESQEMFKVTEFFEQNARPSEDRILSALHPVAAGDWQRPLTCVREKEETEDAAVKTADEVETVNKVESENDLVRTKDHRCVVSTRPRLPGASPGLMLRLDGGRLKRKDVERLLAVGAEDGEEFDDERPAEEGVTDDDTEAASGFQSLEGHNAAVGHRAGQTARAVGLSENEAVALGIAGRGHDLGKADVRQQALLLNCPVAEVWMRPRPTAKSKDSASTAKEFNLRRARAGLPVNWRHEQLSVQIAERGVADVDDLTLHAIASHHGHARPFLPPCVDHAPVDVNIAGVTVSAADREHHHDRRLRMEIAERFWRLHERHGAWGLAYREAALRIADWQVSAENRCDPDAANLNPRPIRDVSPADGVVLAGMDGSNPLAMLATLGLLHIQTASDADLRLHWQMNAGAWRPVLTLAGHGSSPPRTLTRDDVEDWFESWSDRPLPLTLMSFDDGFDPEDPSGIDQTFDKGSGKIISAPDAFAARVHRAVEHYAGGDLSRREAAFAAALGSEATRKRLSGKETDDVDHSQLYMTRGSGHQRMLELMRSVHDAIEPNHYRKTLFEPWAYDDPGRGLNYRWDPVDERQYATRWKDPSGDAATTVLGANDLAINALALFPTAAVGFRLETTGFFYRRGRGTMFSWPIWTRPLSIDVIASLLTCSHLHAKHPEPGVLSAYGIDAVMRCERKRNDKFFNFGGSLTLVG